MISQPETGLSNTPSGCPSFLSTPEICPVSGFFLPSPARALCALDSRGYGPMVPRIGPPSQSGARLAFPGSTPGGTTPYSSSRDGSRSGSFA